VWSGVSEAGGESKSDISMRLVPSAIEWGFGVLVEIEGDVVGDIVFLYDMLWDISRILYSIR